MPKSSLIIGIPLISVSMSVSSALTYTGSIPKRSDIMRAPNQVFDSDNFLDRLIGGIKGTTIAAIGTINPGSLCIQYLYIPQIHYNLSGQPIAFIGNSSNKEGEFSLIKIKLHPFIFFLTSRIRRQWIAPSPMEMNSPRIFLPLWIGQASLTLLWVPSCPISSSPILGSN
jgi:hypothetical protein